MNNHLHSHSAEDRNLNEKSQNERWLLLKYLPNGLPLDSLFEKPERESILRHFQGGNFELADSFNDADFLKHWKVEDVELSHEARAGTHQDSFYAETISYLVSELNEVIQKKKSLTTERRHLLEKNRLLQANYEKITKSKSWQVTLPIRLLAASVRWLKNEIKSIVK